MWKPTTWSVPTICPCCGQSLTLSENMTKLQCTNIDCKSNIEGRIDKWMSVMDIQHVGPAVISDLVELGCKTIKDVYENVDKLADLDGYGQKSISKIKKEMEKKNVATFEKFVTAFNIDGIGEKTVKKFGLKSINDCLAIKDGQSITLDKIKSGVTIFRSQMEDMMQIITIEENTNNIVAEAKLSGLSFCFTGTLSQKRSVLEKMVTDLGGTISSVSRNLTYLVTGDVDSTSSKTKKAKDLGIKIIDEEQFLKILNEGK